MNIARDDLAKTERIVNQLIAATNRLHASATPRMSAQPNAARPQNRAVQMSPQPPHDPAARAAIDLAYRVAANLASSDLAIEANNPGCSVSYQWASANRMSLSRKTPAELQAIKADAKSSQLDKLNAAYLLKHPHDTLDLDPSTLKFAAGNLTPTMIGTMTTVGTMRVSQPAPVEISAAAMSELEAMGISYTPARAVACSEYLENPEVRTTDKRTYILGRAAHLDGSVKSIGKSPNVHVFENPNHGTN